MDKKISVIITCYELEMYLQECVDSIKGQTLLPYEVILIHDGCKEPLAFTGVHVSQRENNIGVAKSRDEGVRISTGDLLLFVDGDDCLVENFLEECMKQIRKGADIAYPNILVWKRWGTKPLDNKFETVSSKIQLKKLVVKNEVVVTSLMKRSVYTEFGGFDPSLEMYEDWWMWILASKHGFKFKRANTFLKYRQRVKGRNQQDEKVQAKVIEQIYHMYMQKFVKEVSTNAET